MRHGRSPASNRTRTWRRFFGSFCECSVDRNVDSLSCLKMCNAQNVRAQFGVLVELRLEMHFNERFKIGYGVFQRWCDSGSFKFIFSDGLYFLGFIPNSRLAVRAWIKIHFSSSSVRLPCLSMSDWASSRSL